MSVKHLICLLFCCFLVMTACVEDEKADGNTAAEQAGRKDPEREISLAALGFGSSGNRELAQKMADAQAVAGIAQQIQGYKFTFRPEKEEVTLEARGESSFSGPHVPSELKMFQDDGNWRVFVFYKTNQKITYPAAALLQELEIEFELKNPAMFLLEALKTACLELSAVSGFAEGKDVSGVVYITAIDADFNQDPAVCRLSCLFVL